MAAIALCVWRFCLQGLLPMLPQSRAKGFGAGASGGVGHASLVPRLVAGLATPALPPTKATTETATKLADAERKKKLLITIAKWLL